MKLNHTLTFAITIFFVNLLAIKYPYAQTPEISWQVALGGSRSEWVYSVSKTADNGFIAGGYTNSDDNGFSVIDSSYDCLAMKFSANGIVEWQRTFGGSGNDGVWDIQQISDGSYIGAATTTSNDVDVTGNQGSRDIWIFKLSASGEIIWQQSYGGTGADEVSQIEPTADGGFLIAGVSYSSDGDVNFNHGSQDLWIFKINSVGLIEWQKNLGGTDYEDSPSFVIREDGSFLFSSRTESNDGDVLGLTAAQGDEFPFGDFWIFNLDSNGNMLWQECLGGYAGEGAWSIDECNDGGFVITGYTFSNNGDVSGYNGGGDCWVVKINSQGDILWQNSIGGSGNDAVYSIIETTDGGYAIAGKTPSNDGDVSGNHGSYDAWVIKLSNTGQLMWQKCLGGSEFDGLGSIIELNSGALLVAGGTESSDGDVVGFQGEEDGWIVQLSNPQSVTYQNGVSWANLYPNPNHGLINFELPYSHDHEEYTVMIRNYFGQTIFVSQVIGESSNLDIQHLHLSGLYAISIIDDRGLLVHSDLIRFD